MKLGIFENSVHHEKPFTPVITEKPRTIEEYFINQLEEVKKEISLAYKVNGELKEENQHLKKIVDTLKNYAKLEHGDVWIHISKYDGQADRNLIAKAFDLKEEEKTE